MGLMCHIKNENTILPILFYLNVLKNPKIGQRLMLLYQDMTFKAERKIACGYPAIVSRFR